MGRRKNSQKKKNQEVLEHRHAQLDQNTKRKYLFLFCNIYKLDISIKSI